MVSIKWSIIWIILHAIILWIIMAILDKLNIPSGAIYLIITGFGITFLAGIIKIYTRKHKFAINKWFFYWWIIHTIAIWIIWGILNFFRISNNLVYLLLSGLGLVIASQIVYKINVKGNKVISVSIILLIIFLFFNIGVNIDLGNLNTFQEGNASSNVTTKTFSSQNIIDSLKSIFKIEGVTCPQINVSMENSYMGLTIKGKEYDGWAIKGDATCRKGTKEGENLNRYYCGGYTYFFGMGDVNAYIQKTIISEEGNIGKTYKYVIWNIYDENKNFVETRCIGNPDEFDKKQAEAFERELLKWN
ncbi:MAG: hypothetical protein ABH849_03385 [Nanoarchaeota archaeon]